MRSFLFSKFALPLHLAFIFGYLAWVQPGPESITSYLPLPFFAAGLFEITLLFPSALKGEEVAETRRRVLRSILRDPVFYIGVAAFLFIVIQTLNGPRELYFDKVAKVWRHTPGKVSFLPACLDQILSIQGAFWVMVTSAAISAIRFGFGKKARNLFFKLLLAVSSALAIYGLASYAANGGTFVRGALAGFATPTEAGAFFIMMSLLAFGMLLQELNAEEPSKYSLRYLLAVFLLNSIAALYSLSCLSIAALVLAILVVAAYSIIFFAKRNLGGLRLSSLAALVAIIAVGSFLHYVAYPKNKLHDCTAKIFNGPWQTQEQIDEAKLLRQTAWRIWDKNNLTGIGTWCYGHEGGMARYIEDDEWDYLTVPDAPHYICGNDFAQFLAEYGTLGFIILISPFAFLFMLGMTKIVLTYKNGTGKKVSRKASLEDQESEVVGFFDILIPQTFAVLIAVTTATAMSFFVPVFRNPLNILTWSTLFAYICVALPKPRKI